MPVWLWWVAGLGVVVAVIYAAISSGPVSPPAPASLPAPTPPVPTSAEPAQDAPFDAWAHAGNHAMDAGEYQTAIRRYTRALELDSTAVSVLVDRGACRHALGDEDGALADFRKALDMAPDHLIARFNTGIAYYTSGRIDSARIWWQQIIRDAPESNEAQRARQILADLKSAAP